jgi:hypothetical protein
VSVKREREREKEIGSCVVKGKVSLSLASVASIFRSGEFVLDSPSAISPEPGLLLMTLPVAVY